MDGKKRRGMARPVSCDVTGRIHHGLGLQLRYGTLGHAFFGGGVGDVE